MGNLKELYRKWKMVYIMQHNQNSSSSRSSREVFNEKFEQNLQIRAPRCETCAVVGSAGALLFGKAYGQEIDRYSRLIVNWCT